MPNPLRGLIRAAALPITVAALAPMAHAQGSVTDHPDYMAAPFSAKRVLDWGTRPDWSPDGTKIAFTEAESRNTPAHELDPATGEVRCLTCHLGGQKDVTRIYYLYDGSFLILAPRRPAEDGSPVRGQELYWMSSELGPLLPIGATGFGEIAITRTPDADGAVRIAWGDAANNNSLLTTAKLSWAQGRPVLREERVLYDARAPDKPEGMTVAEAYGFMEEGRYVTFYTIFEKGDVLDDEMVKVDTETGAITPLYTSPAHTETHLFPDERYGLEESNRASDPDGTWRGLSSHPARFMAFMATRTRLDLPSLEELQDYAPHGANVGFDRPFDLYIVRIDGSQEPRRLTTMGDTTATARQSVISPDGIHIAYAVDPRESPEIAGQGGLYIGTFGAAD
ncbi:MAG: hypothetical protein VYD90_14495 [Pseudomonadota bacterium]|nr:hypothetical protein [Pseudomonadota bacterium]